MTVAIALVDLDDSLFQTRRKCPNDLNDSDLTVMAYSRDGAALSYATPRQMALINWLRSATILVPVTGRSLDALRRVELAYDFAVAAHGGIIVRPGGTICSEWDREVATNSSRYRTVLETCAERFQTSAHDRGMNINVRIIGQADAALYLVAKHRDVGKEAELHEIGQEMFEFAETNWTYHANGNNVAFLPPFLGKHYAVAHLLPELRKLHPALPVIGIGDSATDAPFLDLCDFVMMPSQSQLAQYALDPGRLSK
ncbi:hypothetical protein GCM10011349_41870 [Novosphingobium indicum]|uniref:Sucrose phosphatase-like domain-containing protein n=1 Tax=Novosphingobium indicum TaxID=462949 RepID=A0ABQ2K0T2_9SPHN|nr:hypothetical protein [Novosphingobium indicum]GGN60387.1 hypothetical protein GCM10011349_41870 [Novosphingobium indicum]